MSECTHEGGFHEGSCYSYEKVPEHLRHRKNEQGEFVNPAGEPLPYKQPK